MSRETMAVVGFGKTGKALLRFLLERFTGHQLLLYNDTTPDDGPMQQFFAKRGVRFLVGQENFAALSRAGRIIVSPGVDARNHRFDTFRQRGIVIESEIEFAYPYIEAPIVAVTGTNGKSTTVSLIHHILRGNGKNSILAGNIGAPIIDMLALPADNTIYTLEISSFQLEEINQFKPDTAVMLNLTPDHLDRYKSLDDYRQAKFNLFRNLDAGDLMILNRDDPLIYENRHNLPDVPIHWFSRQHTSLTGAVANQRCIQLTSDIGNDTVSLEHNPLKGIHNLENIMAAALVSRALGISTAGISRSLASFQGLPHRMEAIARLNGVEYINDSKATNVMATLKSISSINDRLVLILGGKDKGGEFSLLTDLIKKRVQKVLLIGSAAETIQEQLHSLSDKFIKVESLEEAVSTGYKILKDRGGVVLLAPGCASFDMFDSFEHRGDEFRRAILRFREELD